MEHGRGREGCPRLEVNKHQPDTARANVNDQNFLVSARVPVTLSFRSLRKYIECESEIKDNEVVYLKVVGREPKIENRDFAASLIILPNMEVFSQATTPVTPKLAIQ